MVTRGSGRSQAFLGIEARSLFAKLADGPGHAIQAEGTTLEVLERVCARPELRPLLGEVRFRLNPDLAVALCAPDTTSIELAPGALAHPALAAFHVRHAMEIVLCHRLAPYRTGAASEVALAIIAAHTALMYLDTLPASDRRAVLELSPSWVRKTYKQLHSGPGAVLQTAAAAACVGRRWRDLLPLQGALISDELLDDVTLAHACALASQAVPVAYPSEHLLTLGADSRLAIDPVTRLNRYGCSSSPRPSAITFSNCTASSPSDLGYAMAEHGRQALLAGVVRAERFSDVFRAEMERARSRARVVLGLDAAPLEIIFAPSATDCEFYALFIALAIHPGNVLNIVVAPAEIGSGSLPAAKGQHFDSIVPAGHRVERGAFVDGIPPERVRTESVLLRDRDGRAIPLDAIDAQVSDIVAQASARGDLVLLHLLDSSKTGLRGPSVRCIRALRERYGTALMVVVDAAQMRISSETLARYLAESFMVIVSGSKFYTGSPFSGGLLVPEKLARALDQVDALPEGLGDYLSAYELPPRWMRLRSQLPMTANVGLLLRWLVALWEMQAFASVPRNQRYEYLHRFAAGFRAAVAGRPNLSLIDAPVGERRPDACGSAWDSVQTIFTFVTRKPSGAALDYDEAWNVYKWLNADIADSLPSTATARERALARKPCHIGQPVRLQTGNGMTIGALRVAAGARLVSRVASDPTLGATPEERLAAQIAAAVHVLDKVDLILRHWVSLKGGTVSAIAMVRAEHASSALATVS